VGTVRVEELKCRCGFIPCEKDADGVMAHFRERDQDAEVTELTCGGPALRLVRVASGPFVYVFHFRDDVLVGFQDGDGDDNFCGGSYAMIGEFVQCEASADCDAGYSADAGCGDSPQPSL
jgi:hypothetical protein